MKEHPIAFDAESVRGTIDGIKTQTRRIIPQRILDNDRCEVLPEENNIPHFFHATDCPDCCEYACGGYFFEEHPYTKGDRLWVKEALRPSASGVAVYAADGTPVMVDGESFAWRWKSHRLWSTFMPRVAARITLDVVRVRVERIQDITLDEANAEGGAGEAIVARWFRERWDSLNANRGYGWDKNPPVRVIQFRLVP